MKLLAIVLTVAFGLALYGWLRDVFEKAPMEDRVSMLYVFFMFPCCMFIAWSVVRLARKIVEALV